MYHGLLLYESFPVAAPKEPQSMAQNLVQPVNKKIERNNWTLNEASSTFIKIVVKQRLQHIRSVHFSTATTPNSYSSRIPTPLYVWSLGEIFSVASRY